MRRSAKSLNTIHEHLGWFESWNVVLWDYDSGVFRDVASCFLRTGLDNEAPEAAKINVLALGQGILHDFHEPFYCNKDSGFVYAGALYKINLFFAGQAHCLF